MSMDRDCKMYIQIEVKDEKEQLTIANAIHEQLRGNQDYIDSNIILNIDVDAIRVYVFEECTDVPTIII